MKKQRLTKAALLLFTCCILSGLAAHAQDSTNRTNPDELIVPTPASHPSMKTPGRDSSQMLNKPRRSVNDTISKHSTHMQQKQVTPAPQANPPRQPVNNSKKMYLVPDSTVKKNAPKN